MNATAGQPQPAMAPAPQAMLPLALAVGRRFASAGLATILLNGFMFVLGIVLVRSLAPAEFGTYTMLVTLLSLASVLINALVAQQMGYSMPRVSHPAAQRASGAVYGSVAGLCIAAFVPVTLATLGYLRVGPTMLAVGAIYVASTMYRNYARFFFFSLRSPLTVLKQDFLFVGFCGVGIALLALGGGLRAGVAAILAVLIGGNLFSSLFFSKAPTPPFRLFRLRRHMRAYRRQTRRAFWSLLNVLLSTLFAVAPNLAIMSGRSLTDLALITAPGSILAPIRLVMITFQSTLRAEFSAMIHQHRLRSALILYLVATAGAAATCAGVALATWFGWDFLYARLFKHGYAYSEIRDATMISVAIAAAGTIRLPGSVLLNAFNVFKYSAVALFVIAPAVLGLAFWLHKFVDVTQVLYATLFGEVTLAAAELVAIVVMFRRQRPTAAGGE